MWQRWGTTNLDFVPDLLAQGSSGAAGVWNNKDTRMRKLMIAEIVAVSAGTIHGSDPVLWEKTGGYLTPPRRALLPDADVTAVDNGNVSNFVGDLHLHDVIGGPPTHAAISNKPLPYGAGALGSQSQRLMGCAKGSVAAVYAALSDPAFGAPVLGVAPAPGQPFDPNDCRAPAVTNLAFSKGIDQTDLQPVYGEWQAVLSSDIPDSVEGLARNDYGRLRHAAQVLAKTTPTGTEMSKLHHGDLQLRGRILRGDDRVLHHDHVHGGAGSLHDAPGAAEPLLRRRRRGSRWGCTPPLPPPVPLAPFADPTFAGPLPVVDALTRSGGHAVAFHGSRAPEMCAAVKAIPARLAEVVRRAGERRGSRRDVRGLRRVDSAFPPDRHGKRLRHGGRAALPFHGGRSGSRGVR